MIQRPFVTRRRIAQCRSGGADARIVTFQPETVQRLRGEVARERVARAIDFEH